MVYIKLLTVNLTCDGRSMAWNANIKNEFISNKSNSVSYMNTKLDLILNQTDRAAAKIPGAQDQIDEAKSAIDYRLNNISVLTDRINGIADSLYANIQTMQANIAARKSEGEQLKTSRDENKSVSDVREEQVSELKHKNEGNYHSAWFGLRPFNGESRTGLLIASIVLGVIALVSIIFLMIGPTGNLLPASMSNQIPYISRLKS